MKPRTRGLLGIAAIHFSLLATTNSVVTAGPSSAPDGVLSWQSAGDSYSSGEGVYGNSGDCAQSDQAYGPTAERSLTSRGWNFRSNTFTACTGHLVEDYFNARPDSGGKSSLWQWGIDQGGPARVDVLTMSFGGNDIGFADIISNCLVGLPDNWGEYVVGGLPSSLTGCDESEQELKARIDALLDPPLSGCTGSRRKGEAGFGCPLNLEGHRGSIIDFYVDIASDHLTSRGQLYIVGYPRLFAPVNQWPGWVKIACQGVLRGDAEKLGRVSEHLNDKLREAVDRANASLGSERVHYLDRLALYADGQHELCGTGEDWLNGIAFDRGDGLGLRRETSFHPNAAGHAGTATALVNLVEGSFPTRASEPVRTTTPTVPSSTNVCAPDCRVINDVPIDTPYGPITFRESAQFDGRCSGWEVLDRHLYAVREDGSILWDHDLGCVAPVWTNEPASDALGHIFLTYDIGRDPAVIVLAPVNGGFDDFGSLPTDVDFRGSPNGTELGRFYAAFTEDTDADGVLEIITYTYDCIPDCASSPRINTVWRWNGTNYSAS